MVHGAGPHIHVRALADARDTDRASRKHIGSPRNQRIMSSLR
jgi:hypothetical protein